MTVEKQIKKICDEHNFKNPVELLTGLTNGVDLRKNAPLYEWLMAFEEEAGDDLPDEFEWLELKELIKNEYRAAPVSTTESLAAQKVLLEYMHPKRKSVDVKNTTTDNGKVTPLTIKEIKRFERNFNKKC